MISVLTPCLNRAALIVEAIESVLIQNYPNFEHIVIDGGSTDGTLEVLKRYPHLRVISEPDEGLYDALNKGVRAARGELIAHLNSDDRFCEGAFHRMAEPFASDPNVESVVGQVGLYRITPAGERVLMQEYRGEEQCALSFENITCGFSLTNARIFRRSVYEKAGLYDIRYRIAGDREFLIRVALSNIHSVYIDYPVYEYLTHEDSLSFDPESRHYLVILKEYLIITEQFLSRPDIPSELRRWCTLLNSRKSTEACIRHLQSYQLKEAFRFARKGLCWDTLWPIAFCSQIAKVGIDWFRLRLSPRHADNGLN